MLILKDSGEVDKEVYSEERVERCMTACRLLNVDNNIEVPLFSNGSDSIEGARELVKILYKGVFNQSLTICSEEISIDYNDRLLDYAAPTKLLSGNVHINGEVSECFISSDNIKADMHSKMFIGTIIAESCSIDITNDREIGIYSILFRVTNTGGIPSVNITYNGKQILCEDIEETKEIFIIAIGNEVFINNRVGEILLLKKYIDRYTELFEKDNDYFIDDIEKQCNIMISSGFTDCYIVIRGESAYKVNVEKLCGRNIIDKKEY